MSEPIVRAAHSADLPRLGRAFGDLRFFTERYGRQRREEGVLFVAFLAGRPVGNVYLWLQEAEEPEIRHHLRGVPLLTHLEVLKDRRNAGIGTTLITHLEQYLRERGHTRVALAVRTDNGDAERLYKRLDYAHWEHGEIVCEAETTAPDGTVLRVPEYCHVMVKDLAAAPLVAGAKVLSALH